MTYLEERAREQEEASKKKPFKVSGKYIASFVSVACVGAALITYFGAYRPEHNRAVRLEKEKIELSSQFNHARLSLDTLSVRLAESESLKNIYYNKTNILVKQSSYLKKEMQEAQAQYDSIFSYNVASLDSLNNKLNKQSKQNIDNLAKIDSLEKILVESSMKISALEDSTYKLRNISQRQQVIISEQEGKITQLTPKNLEIINHTAIGIFAKGSNHDSQQGYGLDLSTRVLGGENSGIRARGSFAFHTDKNKTSKDFGANVYLKDSKSNITFEIGGGFENDRMNSGASNTDPFVYGGPTLNMFGVRGFGIGIFPKATKNKTPSINVGMVFGKK